jgi:DNA-binding NtrC family response regulator
MNRKTIICVDDEQTVLKTLIAQLNNGFGSKYYYEGFTDAEEAFDFINETYADGGQIDLIVCDWLMPRIRGDEFLVRVHRRFPDVRSIMLSGQADPDSVNRAYNEARMLKFLAKPWDMDILLREVENALTAPAA